jgi:hypothetical protein
MTRMLTCWLSVFALAVLATCSQAAPNSGQGETDADFAVQGEYVGELPGKDGPQKFGVQIIALGKGKFQAVGYHGGLPGDGWNREEPVRADGERQGELVEFKSDEGSGVVQNGVLTVRDKDGNEIAKFNRVTRESPTVGKKPPEGAIVLFDGSKESLANWINGRITEDGLLMEGTDSKQKFGDHSVHFEFRLAYQPEARGQGRSNSGFYAQGRYEVQILDSFGLAGKHNECGGIYSVKDPDVNMCFPPLQWQTYDIDYTAARYDADGKLTSNPRITVRHNGVVVHNNVELPGERSTTAAPTGPGPGPGGIHLQNHGNPLRYRNIWVVEKK